MSITLPSGEYIVPSSRVPNPGTAVDPAYIGTLQQDCARNDVQRFLSFSERSSGQLKKKVVSLGYSDAVADNIVNWAIEYSLVDDIRFCRIFISSRTIGRMRLKKELTSRGVPLNIVEKTIASIFEKDSMEELVKQVSRRYGHIEDHDTARRRAAGWLSRRGFSSEITYKVLKEAL